MNLAQGSSIRIRYTLERFDMVAARGLRRRSPISKHSMRDHNHTKEATRNQREVHYGGTYLTTRTYMQPGDNKQTSRGVDNGLCMVPRQFHAEASITMHNYADMMMTMILITRLAAVLGFRGYRGMRGATFDTYRIDRLCWVWASESFPFLLVWASESFLAHMTCVQIFIIFFSRSRRNLG
jgi:hypothetical protein